MRNFFFLSLFFLPVILFAQRDINVEQRDSAYWDADCQDWRIKFFVDSIDEPRREIGGWIVISGFLIPHPAVFLNNQLCLVNPSSILLQEGKNYECFGGFVDVYGNVHHTPKISFKTPELPISLSWKISGGILRTQVIVSRSESLGLQTDESVTQFYLRDFSVDSILGGEPFFLKTRHLGNKFTAEWRLQTEIVSQQFLIFSLQLNDRNGIPRFWGSKISNFQVYWGELEVFNKGSSKFFRPIWNDNKKRQAIFFDVQGRMIKNLSLFSGEIVSITEPPGTYFLWVEGFLDVQKITY